MGNNFGKDLVEFDEMGGPVGSCLQVFLLWSSGAALYGGKSGIDIQLLNTAQHCMHMCIVI